MLSRGSASGVYLLEWNDTELACKHGYACSAFRNSKPVGTGPANGRAAALMGTKGPVLRSFCHVGSETLGIAVTIPETGPCEARLCHTSGVPLRYMYGPSPDCKRKLFDSGSGLLLCIRLLSGAVLLLRAMMESAPSLSSLPQRSRIQTIYPSRIRVGRFDLFSHQQSTCKPGENFINLRRRRKGKREIAL